jgi:DNA uptake protein ComE-like DNA-binding protein/predicted regulator of Ras-like GTPase activity (Roadblock/LC7/MglB family)
MVSLFDFIFKDRQPKAHAQVLDPIADDDLLDADDITDLMPDSSPTDTATGLPIRPAEAPCRPATMSLDEIRLALEKIAEIIQEDEEKEVQEELSKGNFTSVDFSISQVAGLAPNLFRDPEAAAKIKDQHASVLIDSLFEQLSKGKVTTSAERLLKQVQEDLLIPDYLNHRKSEINIPLHLVVSSVRPDELMKRTAHTTRDDQLDNMPNLFSRPGQADSGMTSISAPEPAQRHPSPPPTPADPGALKPPPAKVESRPIKSPSAPLPPKLDQDGARRKETEEDPIFNRSRLPDIPAPETSMIPPPSPRVPTELDPTPSSADELAAAAMQFEFDDSVSVFKLASPETPAADGPLGDESPILEPEAAHEGVDQPIDAELPPPPTQSDSWVEEPAEEFMGSDEAFDPDLEDAPTVMMPDLSSALEAIEQARQQAAGENGSGGHSDPLAEADAQLAAIDATLAASDAWIADETAPLDADDAEVNLAESNGEKPDSPASPMEAAELEAAELEAAELEAASLDFGLSMTDFSTPGAPVTSREPGRPPAADKRVGADDGSVAASLPADDAVLHGVDLNQASPAELVQIPGVSLKLADRIVRHRTEQGTLRSVSALAWVPGMSPSAFEQITGRSWSAARDTVRQTVDYVFGPSGEGMPDLRGAAVRFASLPGFEGCIFTHDEGHVLAAEWDHPQQEMLGALSPQFFKKVEDYGNQLDLGDCSPISIHVGDRVITIVQGGDVFLALIHSAHNLDQRQLELVTLAGAELEHRMQAFSDAI